MQATIVMLMALSGLGCHHKSCAPVVAPACYSSCYSSCYSNSCYSTPLYAETYVATSQACYSSCYSSCYSNACYSNACYSNACYSNACYSNSCYTKHRRMGLFGGLKKHGRCHSNRCSTCSPVVTASYDCYTGGGGEAVYGTYTPVYSTGQSWASAQTLSSPTIVDKSSPMMESAPVGTPAVRMAAPDAPAPGAGAPIRPAVPSPTNVTTPPVPAVPVPVKPRA